MAPVKIKAGRSKRRLKSDPPVYLPFLETRQWAASVRGPKIGGERRQVYELGTHLTKKLAARCQDRIIRLILESTEPSMSQPKEELNFFREDYDEDKYLRDTLSQTDFFEMLPAEANPTSYKPKRRTARVSPSDEEGAIEALLRLKDGTWHTPQNEL